MKKILVGTALSLLFVGCVTGPVSVNYQKAIGRSTGDLTVTVLLESRKGKLDKEDVITATQSVQDYLILADVSKLTKIELIAELEDKISNDKLKILARKIVSRVPAEITPEAAKKVMLAVCKGVIVGASEWDIEDMKKEEATNE